MLAVGTTVRDSTAQPTIRVSTASTHGDAKDPPNACSHCQIQTQRDLASCAKCLSVKYCSVECQRAAWPAHKAHCAALARLRSGGTPARTTRTGAAAAAKRVDAAMVTKLDDALRRVGAADDNSYAMTAKEMNILSDANEILVANAGKTDAVARLHVFRKVAAVLEGFPAERVLEGELMHTIPEHGCPPMSGVDVLVKIAVVNGGIDGMLLDLKRWKACLAHTCDISLPFAESCAEFCDCHDEICGEEDCNSSSLAFVMGDVHTSPYTDLCLHRTKSLRRKLQCLMELERDHEALATAEALAEFLGQELSEDLVAPQLARLRPALAARTHFVALDTASDEATTAALKQLRAAEAIVEVCGASLLLESILDDNALLAFINLNGSAFEQRAAGLAPAEEQGGSKSDGVKNDKAARHVAAAKSSKKGKAKLSAAQETSQQATKRMAQMSAAKKKVEEQLFYKKAEYDAMKISLASDEKADLLQAKADALLASGDLLGYANASKAVDARQAALHNLAWRNAVSARAAEQTAACASEAAADRPTLHDQVEILPGASGAAAGTVAKIVRVAMGSGWYQLSGHSDHWFSELEVRRIKAAPPPPQQQATFRLLDPTLTYAQCAAAGLVGVASQTVCCRHVLSACSPELGLGWLAPAVGAMRDNAEQKGGANELAACNCPTCLRVLRLEETRSSSSARVNAQDTALGKILAKLYRKRTLKLHPDKIKRERTKQEEEQLERLQEAHEVFSDPARRRAYTQAPTHCAWQREDAAQQRMAKVQRAADLSEKAKKTGRKKDAEAYVLAARDANSHLKRLTGGQPNRTALPKLVSLKSVKQRQSDGAPAFVVGLEWLAADVGGAGSFPVEHYSVELQRWHSADEGLAASGVWDKCGTPLHAAWSSEQPLPEGQYLFRVCGVNTNGSGEWSQAAAVDLDVSCHASVVAETLATARREMRRQRMAAARVVLADALWDFRHRQSLGRLRNANARAAMATELRVALKPWHQKGGTIKAATTEDAAPTAEAAAALRDMAAKATQLVQRRARRGDIRQMVTDALADEALAASFGVRLTSMVEAEAETSQSEASGSASSDGAAFSTAECNELFQYVMRMAGKKAAGKKAADKKASGIAWRSHGGCMLPVARALAAGELQFSPKAKAELRACTAALVAQADTAAAAAADDEAQQAKMVAVFKAQQASERAADAAAIMWLQQERAELAAQANAVAAAAAADAVAQQAKMVAAFEAQEQDQANAVAAAAAEASVAQANAATAAAAAAVAASATMVQPQRSDEEARVAHWTDAAPWVPPPVEPAAAKHAAEMVLASAAALSNQTAAYAAPMPAACSANSETLRKRRQRKAAKQATKTPAAIPPTPTPSKGSDFGTAPRLTARAETPAALLRGTVPSMERGIASNPCKCGLCFERMSGVRGPDETRDRRPAVLVCQHTFCRSCLQLLGEQMRGKAVVCPACDQVTVCNHGTSALPCSALTLELLQFVEQQEQRIASLEQQLMRSRLVHSELACPQQQMPPQQQMQGMSYYE